MDDYGLDPNTKRLSLINRTKDKTDFVQSGSYDKDGKFMANDKSNSSIMISKGVLNAKDSQQDLSKDGFVTTGGNQKDGVDLMCFISNQTGVEVAAKGFSTKEGQEELLVGHWDGNTVDQSVSPGFNQEGTVMFDVHTHFIGKDNNPGLGFGVASKGDFSTKTNYPAYYIISQRNGLTQYFPAPGRGKTFEERQKYTVYPSISTIPSSLKDYLNP